MPRLTIFALFALVLASVSARAEAPTAVVMLEHGAAPVATFKVEVATSPEERAQGLMNREVLDPGAGMLFDYGEPTMARMWMKNTRIPLDMLFVDEGGIIRHIHAEAKPNDETPIATPVPVRWVLEIPGGRAAQLKLQEGDRMKVTTPPAKPTIP
ncbi:conserved exported hypothetical protein [uncultured Alphaproteobacteria bacterium]|uniref:DUF192 domain-containing protein n=1 Tax=uncultured Alphaproteobacteria bacterium TaxID=91750 RepID=A0A212IYN5_9PROT|nr:conserved exported hypothetical protein [uncultured Alphaproteobacteria bacterium]